MERERAIGAVDGAAADLILDAGQRRPAAAGEGPAGGVDHLRTAKTSNVRQLSAVLLRKKTRPLGQALCQGRPSREHHPRPQVALILFCPLTETIGPISQSHLAYLQPILLKRLQDGTSIHVRVAALKVLCFFIEFINDGMHIC
ncbi:uncharacterized protein [Elaeis guineensis]|uniref:uncharacterized protein isoform X4 n=1 Tax=Elaeis guineensis var. tenera TaxID=51953 RepID=UPI003C6CF439